MLINMKPILSGDTDIIKFDYPLDISSDISFEDITFTSPVSISGEVKNNAGYMELSLSALVEYQTFCARCLVPLQESLTVDLVKSVAEKLSGDENDDYILIRDSMLDADELIKEQISLELPLKHLCSEDCKGLCPKCGKDLNEGDCDCSKKDIDPRLEVLKKFFE